MIALLIITMLVQILTFSTFAAKKEKKASDDHIHEWVYENVEEKKDNKLEVTRYCEDKKCEVNKDNPQVDKIIKQKSDYEPKNGWMEKLAIPFGAVIRLFYNMIPVYAVALFLFAIAMKIILFPFGIKQQKNMIKQAKLRPKETAIRKKYAGRNDKVTQQKVQQEIMDLYQKENFNPASGCLPLLLQMPILFALFRVIYNPLRFTCHLTVDKISEIGRRLIDCQVLGSKGDYLTAAELQIGDLPIATLLKDEKNLALVKDLLPKGFENPDLTFFGIDLSRTPQLKFELLLLIPVVTFLTVYFSSILIRKLSYQPQQTADAKASGCIMDWMMPLMSTWFAFMYPAVLGLYWIFQNILSVLQQLILKKMYPLPVFTEADYQQAEKEILGKGQNKKKKPGNYKRHPNSLHHVDDDEDDIAPAPKAEPKKPSEPKSSNDLITPAPLKDDEDN